MNLGFTLIGLIMTLAIIGILAAIVVPYGTCAVQRGKMTAALADISIGADLIEAFEVEHGEFPRSLEELYIEEVPKTLIYCVDDVDPNSGHGNEICAFFDNDNPSGQNQHGGIPSLGFLLATIPNIAPCRDFSFAWTFCCGRDPVHVTTGEESSMPGHPGNPGGPGNS